MARSGNREMAEQMLNELRDLLDRLQSGRMADQQQSQQLGKMMDEFGEIIGKQQGLLDDTFGEQQQGGGSKADRKVSADRRARARRARARTARTIRAARSAIASASCASAWAGCSAA